MRFTVLIKKRKRSLPPLRRARAQMAAAAVELREAYATLWYGDVNSPSFGGLTVLFHSVRQHDSRRPIVLMRLDDEELLPLPLQQLCHRFNVSVVPVPRIVTSSEQCLATLGSFVKSGARVNIGHSTSSSVTLGARSIFSVYNVWNLTQFDRIVWLESDQLVLKPLHHLWDLDLLPGVVAAAASVLSHHCSREWLSPGFTPWPPGRAFKYNTGLILLRPNATVMGRLISAVATKNYRCTDGYQTLWNRVLGKRVRCLHHTYNCVDVFEHPISQSTFGRSAKCLGPNATVPHVLHFASASKPWLPATAARVDMPWPHMVWRAHCAAAHCRSVASGATSPYQNT